MGISEDIRRCGSVVTLRRRIGTTSAFQSVVVHAVMSGFAPHEVAGLVEAADRKVTIPGDLPGFPGAPGKGDSLLIGGRAMTVLGAEPKALGSKVLAYVLHCRG